MVRQHQPSDAQLRIGESRDSGLDASHRPGMTVSGLLRFARNDGSLSRHRSPTVSIPPVSRPLSSRHRPRGAQATLTVIASEAKQSTARTTVTMDCFVASLLAMTVSPLLHQRVARGGELLKFLRVAAGVGMGALVGLVDFRAGQAAAERQAEHLP